MSLNPTTDAAFDADVLESSLPVLVDFTAEWCPPCKMILPVLERIAADEAGRLRIVSLDVDVNPLTAQRYGVLGMPTLSLFVNGEVVTQVMGARPRAAIMKEIEDFLPVRT